MAETRLELDIRGVPLGVIPTLREKAGTLGLSLTAYCKTVLVEHALKLEQNGKP